MDVHVKVLGFIHIVNSALLIAVALLVAVIGGVIGIAADDEAAAVVPIVATVVSLVLILLAAPGLLGGLGLLKYRAWARIVVVILSVLNLPSIPVGTAIGVYGLWVLLNDETGELFSGPVRRRQPYYA